MTKPAPKKGQKAKASPKPKAQRKPSSFQLGGLSASQELFCHYYALGEGSFSNATWAYAHAYDYRIDELADDDAVYQTIVDEAGKEYEKLVQPSTRAKALNVCGVEGHRLLKNPKILARIEELLNDALTDTFVDAELYKVIRQSHDLGPKVRAISEYNKLRQRITDRMDITSGGKTIADLILLADEPDDEDEED